jgi:hypothetical protein
MKGYLDMQVEEKKRFSEFEKTMNSEQARVWKTDTEQYHQQEKEIYDKVISILFRLNHSTRLMLIILKAK